ncbi:MAG: hypothetical protein R3C45_18130 [Phycisphaerales bacterium]
MSVKRIMQSEAIICTVPDERKAGAVADAVDGPVTSLAGVDPPGTAVLPAVLGGPAASLLKQSGQRCAL